MITLRKLATLKDRTRRRKISMIMHEVAVCLSSGREHPDYDRAYMDELVSYAGFEPVDPCLEGKSLAFRYEDMSQSILSELGAEPSDWDFTSGDGTLDSSHRIIEDKVLVLDRLRSPYNVGAVFRSADSFGIRKIILVEGTASPDHVRAKRTSRGTTDTVQWQYMSVQDTISFLKTCDSKAVLALELGGEDINSFAFPHSGVAILGSEEFGISPEILECAGSRITIAMGGSKGSLNVSVAAGILMQHWFGW